MKLIDRYVYAVTKYLSEEVREDVGKELRSNIEDMLPDNPSEEEVYKALKQLGNPWKLANEYNPKKQYLIGPGYYNQYLSILKLVVGICITVFIGIAMLAGGIELAKEGFAVDNYSKLISSVISAAFEGAIQGALWVTLVFVILERSGVETGRFPFSNKEWKPEDLPELPIPANRVISRRKTIVSMCCTIFFTALVCFQPHLIAVYFTDNSGSVKVTQLFNLERLDVFIPFIIIVAFVQLGIFLWKYMKGSWNVSLAIGNAVYNLLSSILLIIMVSDKNLFNMNFFYSIAERTNSTNETVLPWIDRGIWVFIAVVVVICIWETGYVFIKCLDLKKK